MILNDWLSQSFIESIPYIETNEKDNSEFIYAYVRGLFGNKTVSSIVDNCKDTPATVAKIIDLLYSDKWATIKKSLDAVNDDDGAITGTTDTDSVITDNTIYGYNDGENGAHDYKTVVTTNKHTQFSDLYKMIENNVAMRDALMYYRVMAYDIAYVVTTDIYFDSEGSETNA